MSNPQPTPGMLRAAGQIAEQCLPVVCTESIDEVATIIAREMAEEVDAEKDNCEFCLGAKGGTPGNENRIGGKIVCDYCTSMLMAIDKANCAAEFRCHEISEELANEQMDVNGTFLVELIQSGQVRAYGDTVRRYKILSDLPEDEVKSRCITEVRAINPEHEVVGARHDGACGFPFGLESFFSFKREGNSNIYHFVITEPYCD